MDELDDKIINHIREAFENFDDPGANDGWLLLREKFPPKNKKHPVIWPWLTAAAAVLLLALGIGTWFTYQKRGNEKLMSGKPLPIKHDTKNNPDALAKSKSFITKPDTIGLNQRLSLKKPIPQHLLTAKTSPLKSEIFTNKHKPLNIPGTHNLNNNTAITSADDVDDNQDKAINSPVPVVTENDTNAVKKIIAAQQPQKQLLLPDISDIKYEKTASTKKTNASDKKVKFGLYAATYFNYAKGSENQVNMGAGFTSDIKLSKNIKLSTGVAIAQNTLNYIDHSPTQAIQNNALAYAYASNINAAGYTTTTPIVKNYNALLVGLDIPLNLKYEFNPQKNHSYIAVGLSSGTFINQTYTYNYNIPGAAAQQPQTEKANGFSDFYFAKTLNVSFGVGYPLGKKNHLIIEPFLKYPLAGLGSQQIYFGAGGLNLRFDFQSAKK